MCHGHQARADRANAVAAQQVQSQGAQQAQHLDAIALAVEVGVLAELGVAGPMPLVFDRPALPHKPQQRFRAGAQGGDEQVDVVKRLAVTPARAHQLDDPTGTFPALADGVCGIACSELPAHLAAMAGLKIADLNREVPVATELGDDLLVQPALVVLDRQEQVGALLGGELKNAGEVCKASAWIRTPSSSRVLSKALRAVRSWDSPVSNEVWAIATPSSRA